MKKTLATLGVIGMLGSGADVYAKIDSTKDDIKQDLIENMSIERQRLNQSDTITLEEAKRQHQLFEDILKDVNIQNLINEYGKEEVEKMISEIITNEDTEKVIDNAFKDEKLQKLLEEGNEEAAAKRIREITKNFYKESFLGRVIDKVFFGIMIVLIRESFRRRTN